jgi:hypothetical protein
MRFLRSAKKHRFGPTEWLELIHAANAIDPAMFGEPAIVKNGPCMGDYAEQYEHAWVYFPADDPITVRVSALTEHGSVVLSKAYDEMKKAAAK